jgi:hypothetical protein
MNHISLNLRGSGPRQIDGRPNRNNVWHTSRNSDRVLVFVHGFTDDTRNCWFNKEAGSYWPDRVASTEEFNRFSIFLAGYETSLVLAGDYGIPDCADAMFKSLRLKLDGKRAVLEHQRIAFLCHSMGGIVTRYMLDFYQQSFTDRAIGLFMIASPSSGSKWADVVRYIADNIGHEQLKTLAAESQLLIDLDRRFKGLVHGLAGRPGARIYGREACETKGFKLFVPAIVSSESAGRYFGPVQKLEDTDHRTCVKPDSDHHPAHLFLRECILDFEQRLPEVSLRPVRTDLMQCGRLRRTVLIENDDGDAQIETSLLRVISAPNGMHKLRPVKIWSGYRSKPKLAREGEATTPSVTLGTTDVGDPIVIFNEAPGPGKSVNATWRYWSASVFSMNNRELRLKNKGIVDEEFVATKIQDAQFDDLVVHVQLPEAMNLVGAPYAKVLQITDEKQGALVDDGETARTRDLIDYSPMLRTITWVVPRPLLDRSYRVCWRLAEVPERPSQLTSQEQLRHVAYYMRLVRLRACLKRSTRTSDDQAAVDAFDVAISEWRALFSAKLGPLLQWEHADMTLMLLDDSHSDAAAQLYMIGGINVEVRDEALAVGEGNAGRAVKRERPRTWDSTDKSDVDRYGYKPAPGGRNHRWLLSIPLVADRAVYGVVNLGTFDEAQVPVFKQLSSNLTGLSADVQPIAERLLEKLV